MGNYHHRRRRRFLWCLLTASILLDSIGCGRGEVTREFEISEGVPVGTSIGFIGEQISGSFQPPPPYLIVPVPGSSVDSDLIIDQSNGEIRTRIPLDRETRDLYSLVAIPISGENIRVIIRVKDENDHAPQFPSQYMSVEFPENTPGDVKRTLQPARDKDLGIYNTQRYRISSGNVNNAFRLSSHRERDGVLYLDLQVNGFLDRETIPFYNLFIDAFDGGVPPLKGSMTVNVTIQDVNDNQPIFNQSRYFASVPENATVGTSVLQVCATDTDAGPNGQIFYSINRRQTDRDSIFVIDKDTGVISVNRPLDFESKEVHELVVVAKDNGVQPLETTVFVSISVIDVNDNQPVISLIFLTDDATPKISEGAHPGEFVARISVHDPDSKQEYSNVNVTLEGGGGHFGLTTRNGVVYLVIISQLLDREIMPNYTLSVIATDRGSPPLNASCVFHLNVLDINDNPPKFTQDSYEFTIEENNQPGAIIGKVSAVDRDIGQNGSIRYGIQLADLDFQIDPVTGILRAMRPLDREKESTHKVQVIAYDQGTPKKQSQVIVTIQVSDVNDNAPTQVGPGEDVLLVREEQGVGSEVTRVVATDPDNGANGTLTYSLVNDGQSDSEDFTIDPNTGVIRTRTVLDHEKKAYYTLGVSVRDRGNPSLETVQDYRIQILHVNDERQGPTRSKFTFQVQEDIAVGQVVGMISAAGASSGGTTRGGDGNKKARKFIYILLRGNTHDTFEIDKTTGTLLVASPVKYERASHYLLQVKALETSSDSSDIDSSFPFDSLPTYISVEIDIVDVNNHPPRFHLAPATDPLVEQQADSESSLIDIHISESASVGSVLWNFTATDLDEGLSGMVHYEIFQPSSSGGTDDSKTRDDDADGEEMDESKFRMNALTGTLYLQAPLDYETESSYVIVVRATDQSPNPSQRLNSSITARITVQDENDNGPRFLSTSKVSLLYSVEPVGSVLHTVIATDTDSAENGRVTYEISSGNELGYFTLNGNTGELSLAKPLLTLGRGGGLDQHPQQHEERTRFRLNITASDHGSPVRVASQLLQISLDDTGKNSPPRFTRSKYEARIAENSLLGTQVVKVMAQDRHGSPNGTLVYVIPEGMAEGKFVIHSATGSISVAGIMDREERSSYVLTVYVHDRGAMWLLDTAQVLIELEDENDNAPTLHDTCGELFVPENSDLGIIHTFTALDPDLGRNGEVTFSIASGNAESIFSVDPHTGRLSSRPLDRERRAVYELVVLAQDGGLPVQRSYCNLTVNVLDVNDNSPNFLQSTYTATIGENVAIGTTVLTVEATDADVGINSLIKYSLNNESHWHFKIDNTTGAILTAGRLDREKIGDYMFEVTATDGGLYDSRSSSALVHIKLTDHNDNAPSMQEQNPVHIQIAPNTKPGQKIAQLTATDADQGINADITYSIIENPERKFRVQPQTGIITPAVSLAGEGGGIYNVRIQAKDQGIPSLSSTALVIIQVGDVPLSNTLRFQQSNYQDRIPENSPSPTQMVQVTALRNDGRRTRIQYGIEGGNEDGIFEIVPSSGLLQVKDGSKLDRETKAVYNLVISAKTEGPTPLLAYTTVQVNVTDENDNSPRFTQDSYLSSVWEGNHKGTFVTQVTATDNDEGSNANLIYHIVDGNHDNAFIIEPPFSGIVKTNIVLDREIQDRYRLTIIATDDGSPQMTGTCLLQINVIDINDNQPVAPHAVVNISESLAVGSFVTTIVANDVDTNPSLVYSFAEQSKNEARFSIEKYSGRVTLRKPLDYETEKIHKVHIQVSDTVHTAFTSLTVHVMDANDNAPEFTSNLYHVTVPDDTKAGSEVIQVEAADKDSGQNAIIRYSLRSSKDSRGGGMRGTRGFWIDENTGKVYLNGSVQYQHENPFVHLTAVATDGGKPRNSVKATLWIEIRPSESDLLRFSPSKYNITVSEGVKPGTLVTKLNVEYDKKLSNNIHFHYKIIEGNRRDYFGVTSHTGELLVMKPLDREDEKVIKLKVSAECIGTAKCRSVAEVQIYLADINDNPPVFNQSLYRVSVSESTRIGTRVYTIQASDPDGDAAQSDNQHIRYDITSGNEASVFELNPRSGSLVLKRSLDYDTVPNYRFVVRAADTRRRGLWSLVIVQVDIQDENDNAPQFPFPLYLEFVAENEPVGTSVFTARAFDLDKGVYGKLNYSIIEGDGKDKFVVDSATGLVKTATVFDYETRNVYYFTLRATDMGGQSARVKVRVDIESRDEYPPRFLQQTYRFVIPINAGPGYTMGKVEAKDQDYGPDGLVFYQLKQPSDYVRVNRTTGAIILRQSVDSSNSDLNMSIIVLADSGRPGSKSTVAMAELFLGAPSDELEMASSAGVADWVVGLLVTLFLLLFFCCTIFIVLHLRQKKQSKKTADHDHDDKSSETYNNSAFDTLEYAQHSTIPVANSGPNSLYSPQYSDLADLAHDRRHNVGGGARVNHNTVSEMSDQSHSASSGRGSAEDGEEEVEDEEIRMINEGSLGQKLSGLMGGTDLHGDYDNVSQSSAKNTQEYLARLGIIRPNNNKNSDDIPPPSQWAQQQGGGGAGGHHPRGGGASSAGGSLHNQCMYEDEGGGEGDGGMDISTLIYSQIPEDISINNDSSNSINNNSNLQDSHRNVAAHHQHQQPSMNGSLSSIVHSEEELTGSYNWDYLHDWGPQYQPLAHVFSEIARLKDGDDSNSAGGGGGGSSSDTHYSQNSSRHNNNHHNSNNSAPSLKSSGGGSEPSNSPIISNSTPKKQIRHHQQQQSRGQGGGMMTCPLPLLPRSPISHHDANIPYGSGPMSPSFSPALSPLANPSPSMSSPHHGAI